MYVFNVLATSDLQIIPKHRYYQKLQADEFWKYVGNKKNKVWLVDNYKPNTSKIVTCIIDVNLIGKYYTVKIESNNNRFRQRLR